MVVHHLGDPSPNFLSYGKGMQILQHSYLLSLKEGTSIFQQF